MGGPPGWRGRGCWPKPVAAELVGPGVADAVDGLVGEAAAVGERDAEDVELGLDVAGADAEDDAAAGELVEGGERLGRGERVAVGGDVDVAESSRVRVVMPASQPRVATVSYQAVAHRLGPVGGDGDVVADGDVVEAGVVGGAGDGGELVAAGGRLPRLDVVGRLRLHRELDPDLHVAPRTESDGPSDVLSTSMPDAVIVATGRTPIGRAFKGSLVECRPDDLAALAIKEVVAKVPQLDPAEIEDVIMGCGQPGGESGFNIARVAALLAGIDAPGVTVNRYCSSSLQTIRMAAHAIKAGEGDVFVAAGVETSSRFQFGMADDGPKNPLFDEAGVRVGQAVGRRRRGVDAAVGAARHLHRHGADGRERGRVRERVAARRWTSSPPGRSSGPSPPRSAGFFDREIIPVTTPSGAVVTADDGPRPGTTVEKLATLQPVFRPDGEVTAGNACPLNDGAAAVVVMSETKASALGIDAARPDRGVGRVGPEARRSWASVRSRRRRQALARAGLTIDDIDQVEINEAFAAQVLPSAKHLGIDIERQLNPNGGAIALGHPFGMTGARIMTTLINGLEDSGGRYGLETMCVGGGQGMAMIIERL